jgi:predicted  nucleic acid-binding Zn-ribbon protein
MIMPPTAKVVLPARTLRKIRKCAEVISAKRDELRELLDEAQSAFECCNDGLEALETAIDTFSQQF